MFANFTEETCTGTAATLALAGATADHIAFQESFADGDLVAYALEDSGGVIKVAGIGTYVSATDDITRNDTWNWNGTVVDKNPAANITLSGGAHTIRCDLIGRRLETGGIRSGNIYTSPAYNEVAGTTGKVTDNRINYTALAINYAGFYDGFAFEVKTVGAGDTRVGLYTVVNGNPDKLIAVHDTGLSVSTVGLKIASFDGGSIFLEKGSYAIGLLSDVVFHCLSPNGDSTIAGIFGADNLAKPMLGFSVAKTYSLMPDQAPVTPVYQTFASSVPICGVVAT